MSTLNFVCRSVLVVVVSLQTAQLAVGDGAVNSPEASNSGDTGRSRFDALVVVDSAQRVRALEPDFAELARVPVRGVIVTGPSDDARFDFVSRFFGPAVGIDEDPVTGSAHCCLAPYWGDRLGKSGMTAFQSSQRGGVLSLRLDGDRVHLGVSAVTVLKGELTESASP